MKTLTKDERLSEPMLWDELADEYDSKNKGGRRARTLPMNQIFEWAKKRTDEFKISADGTLHKIKKEKQQ